MFLIEFFFLIDFLIVKEYVFMVFKFQMKNYLKSYKFIYIYGFN